MDDKNHVWKKHTDDAIFDTKNKDKRHAEAIFFVLVLCFLLAYAMNQVDEIGKVYTHLFYIPIIMTGAWFRKKAFFLALPLSVLHVFIEYKDANEFTYAPFVRISVFLMVTCVIVMISEKKHTLEQELIEQLAYIQQMNNTVGDLMGRCDQNGTICYVTPSVEKILGYQQEDMVGHNFLEFIYDCDKELLSKDILYTIETHNEFRREYRAVKQNKELAWLEIVMNPMLQNQECTGAVFLCTDITKRKKDETDFKEKVYRDELTGLKNRRFIDEVFEKEIEESNKRERDFSVMMIDIDFFKKVNDTYGHPVGDKVLIRLAQLLKQSVRKYDHVARFGGEEFLILLPGVDEYMAWEIAERMRELVAKNKFETVQTITISIGISIHVKDDSAKSLYQKADEALYIAKQRGRNRVAIYSMYGFMPMDYKTFSWNNKWESGEVQIDEQHKELVEMVNHLAEGQLHKVTCTNVVSELQKMKNKFLEHCRYEEAFFEKIQFEYQTEHIESHYKIHVTFERIIAFTARSEVVDTLVLYQFLVDIFVGHMQNEDKRYFDYIK